MKNNLNVDQEEQVIRDHERWFDKTIFEDFLFSLQSLTLKKKTLRFPQLLKLLWEALTEPQVKFKKIDFEKCTAFF